jgi:prefoldin subunit 5
MIMTSAALALFCGLGLVAPQAATKDEKRPVRVYTNEDLERVHPYRNETGVASVPAAAGAAAEARPDPASRTRARSEAYWRREAARVRERVRALDAQATALRASLAEREEETRLLARRRRGSSGSSASALQARLAALERRRQELQADLEERARREGALPGWLR